MSEFTSITEGAVARTGGLLRSEEPTLSAEELRTAAEETIALEAKERSGSDKSELDQPKTAHLGQREP